MVSARIRAWRRARFPPFARAFVLAGGSGGPCGDVIGIGKPTEVQAQFGEDHLGGAATDAGNRAQQRHRRGHRMHATHDLLVSGGDPNGAFINMAQELVQEEPLMVAHQALERGDEGVIFLAQSADGEAREDGGVGFPGDQAVPHRPAGDVQHVRGHRGEFDVGAFQHLLHPINIPGSLREPLGPLARDFAQFPLGLVGDKTRGQEPMA